MKKRGITIISLSIIVIVMLILLSVVSVSLNYSIANAKKMAFVKEIYNIQSLVTEYIEKEETLPNTKESITIDLTKLNSKYLNQFDGETILQNKVDLYVLDLLELDIKNTNYGDKNIGSTDEEKEKDVYAVSEKTGRVYYIAGFESDGEKYYTLTDELRQMIEKNQNITIGEKTITFTPSKIGWSNEGVSVDVFVPSEFTSQAITVDNANITYTTTSDSNGIYYMVNSAKIAEDYTITISYTKNGKTDSATYTAKIDTSAPVISKNVDIPNTETRVKGIEASDNKSGIKYFKYSEGVIEEKDVKEYMHAYGRNIKKGTLKFDAKSKYTLYAEDKSGNYTVMYINILGDLAENVTPPTLAASNTWYKGTVTKNTITAINIVDIADETTVTTAIESWPAAVDKNNDGVNDDDIMCYVNGTLLTIAGNGNGGIKANENSSRAFGTTSSSATESFSKLSSINGFEILDTSNVTNMSIMFAMCSGLTELDLTGLDTTKVTNMNSMFARCTGLKKLDITGLDTKNVTDMTNMFNGCIRLTELDLTGLNTKNVTKMNGMFSGCSGLTMLGISGINTANVTDMTNMFNGCSSLTRLDLTGLNTTNVTSMNAMFSECSGLTELDVSGFNTAKVKNMTKMFNGCSALTELDLTGFVTNSVQYMQYMFSDCDGLRELDLTGFNTTNVTNMTKMFMGCVALTKLNISNFNTSKISSSTGLNSFAYECDKLTQIILGENFGQSGKIPASGSTNGMFYNSSETIPTTVYGANDLMKSYDWVGDNRNVTFE